MADHIIIPKHETIPVTIDNVKCDVTAFLSMHDFEAFIQNDSDNAKYIFAEFVHKKIVPGAYTIPTVDEIASASDENFKPLIDALLKKDSTLQECFGKQSEDAPLCQRFVFAVKDESKIFAQNIAEAFKNVVIPKFDFPVHQIIENIGNRLQQITNAINSIVSVTSELWKSIQIPTISEERKAEIASAQVKWGELGWTQPPNSPIGLFSTAPGCNDDANKVAMQYCTSEEMEDLFNILRGMNRVKKSDIEEAIFDYKNGKYKSSVLVLFGLIDARLIRLQRKEDRNAKGRRAVGASAAKKLFSRIEKEQDIKKKCFLLFSFLNVNSCLQKVFEDGDDFKKQPLVINRNFVDHGMMHRKVTKRDCIQLFLLYYNLMEFLDIISPSKED